MDPNDFDKTVFITCQGLCRVTVMPFSLCNAPATFERSIVLIGWKVCRIYMDDVIVYDWELL